MGIGLNSGPELRHFFQATRSWRSAAYVARRILGHWAQVIVYGRGVRLVNGNALAARLYKSALDLGVEIQTNAPVLKLVRDNDRVSEVHFGSRDAETRLRALRGVVLATGGWSGSTEQQRVHFPHVATGSAHYSLVPPGNCGDGLKLAVALGGAMNTKSENAAAWAPVSRPPRADGSQGIFFHLVDRAKPGVIMVGADGQRFCNESDCYHDVVQAMLLHAQACGKEGAFLLCDHLTLRRYGLGAVRPAPLPFQKHLRSGYLIRGGNWAELACHLDLPADVLEATVAKYNSDVDAGTDQSFGRGRTAYNRLLGDPGSKQNPCMGHLAQGPFYAVRLWPGDLGAYVGLETDMHGRVLDEQRNIIKGLYAAGSDVTTFAGGSYPGAGAMIGPALTFGYLCGRDLAKHPSSSVSAPS